MEGRRHGKKVTKTMKLLRSIDRLLVRTVAFVRIIECNFQEGDTSLRSRGWSASR